jgi:hypothetical protein
MSLMGQIIAKKPMDWRGRHEFGTTGTAATGSTPPDPS